LNGFDRMSRVLNLYWREPDCSCRLDEPFGFVSAQVSEPLVVAAVRAPKDRRDVTQSVRNGHPRSAAGAQDTCDLA
jgi:hypothetical protein